MCSYINIHKNEPNVFGSISITGSKSISNRLLILKALYKNDIFIENISNCKDTNILKYSLCSNSEFLDINHAGTAMRFLTSYFSIQKNRITILTGSSRMKERPISILVEALNQLGAKITYLEKTGYPPIKILGKDILGGKVNLDARVSSQYISSLMLVASKFKIGLKISLLKKVTSIPYIKMTFDILKLAGIRIFWEGNNIGIFPGKKIGKKKFYIESDWSSASYYYSMAAISNNSNIKLNSYSNNSFQGDKKVAYLYEKHFGISTTFKEKTIILNKKSFFEKKKFLELDLNETPDLAQTIAVTCAAIGIKCYLKGLETLKIKETDRLLALKIELSKFGIISEITDSCIAIKKFIKKDFNHPIIIETYQDHRMAMSFIPFVLLYNIPLLKISNPNVVEKSYPLFWKDLKSIGFSIK
ncbi:3-phosphoshikimate 1-carboxyvinyltransferase [Blattabacterium cuenoti]|uniref:3-phosphoshikimate 1-carboxyvinyltransferase n=1 Tax=Blattabacterium cuenoti TaxID=1653831 RepID=UPI00163CDD4C|nr:3-phosphoshikimate 1-carboxyvinyltransferase [Blattabacterium cuenoti]